uniref:Uncharacterized protein n=1 Tax=Amphimedon queenslandica TaxID=400682 RepID=A0A1X7V3J0_AMPQE
MRKLVLETVTTLGDTFVMKLVCIFCSLIETEYEAVEDMEEEKETEDCAEDIDPPLFDPEVAVELQVSDLELESVMPDAPAALTTHTCDDMRKEDQQEEELSKFFEHGCGCSDNCYALFSHSYTKNINVTYKPWLSLFKRLL